MTKTLQRVNQTRRASAEIWVDAAYEQLIAEGSTASALCPLPRSLIFPAPASTGYSTAETPCSKPCWSGGGRKHAEPHFAD